MKTRPVAEGGVCGMFEDVQRGNVQSKRQTHWRSCQSLSESTEPLVGFWIYLWENRFDRQLRTKLR